MIAVSALLFLAALMIGWDGYKAYLRYHTTRRNAGVRRPRWSDLT
jgi:hypothetical protein